MNRTDEPEARDPAVHARTDPLRGAVDRRSGAQKRLCSDHDVDGLLATAQQQIQALRRALVRNVQSTDLLDRIKRIRGTLHLLNRALLSRHVVEQLALMRDGDVAAESTEIRDELVGLLVRFCA